MRRARRSREDSVISLLGGAGIAALAGFAIGVYVTQRAGGFAKVLRDFRRAMNPSWRRSDGVPDAVYSMSQLAHDDSDDLPPPRPRRKRTPREELERRVLEAFQSDPVLTTVPVEISARNSGLVVLRGRAKNADQRKHASTIAGGVPGVNGVSNLVRVTRPRDHATTA